MPIGQSGVANFANTTQGAALNTYAPGGLGGSGEVVQYSSAALSMPFSVVPSIPASLTWGRTTTGTVVDVVEGKLNTCKVGEARFTGRRVENLLSFSEDFSNAVWIPAQSGTAALGVKTPNYGIAPDGTTTACRIQLDVSAGSAGNQSQVYRLVVGLTVSTCWVKTNDGTTKTIMPFKASGSPITITGNWQPISCIVAGGFQVLLIKGTTSATADLLIWHPMGENTTGQANQNPSEYVSTGVLPYPYHGAGVDGVKYFSTTNGNTVTSNVVTEAPGTPLTGVTLLCEGEARTNLCLQSNAFTTTWVIAGTPTPTQNVTGPDGVANSAWTLTDNDTALTEGVTQTITLSATTYTGSCFIKKTIGAQPNYPRIVTYILANTQASSITIDTSNGIVTPWTALTGYTIIPTTTTCVSVNVDYWRVSYTFTTTNAGSYITRYEPAAAANATQSTGTTDVTVQGSGIIYGFQLEAAPNASSYIPTTTTALTRTADVPSFTGAGLSWYNAQQGTFVIKASGQYSSAPGNIGVWNPLLTGEGTYAIRYNRPIANNAYLYLPNAEAGVNPVEYQDIPTPTTILLAEQGIMNISSWTYYASDLTPAGTASLVNGTLTTAFDVSYAATTSFTGKFKYFPYSTFMKAMAKINASLGTSFNEGWNNCTGLVSFPLLDTSKGTNFTMAWVNCTGLVSFPLLDTSKGTNFTLAWGGCNKLISFPLLDTSKGTNFATAWIGCNKLTYFPSLNLNAATGADPSRTDTGFYQCWKGCTLLANFPPNMFDTCRAKNYTEAFNNCALTQSSVDNILVSVATAAAAFSLSSGVLNMTGGTNAAPSAVGIAAKDDLVNNYSWTITTN